MDFDFNSEQYMVRDNVRAMLDEHWSLAKTRALALDPSAGSHLRPRLAEMGLTQILVPEPYGGLGLGVLDFVFVAEEMGRALAPRSFQQSAVLGETIARFASEEQKKLILPSLASGALSLALADETPQRDLRAEPQTGGGWKLSGRATLVPDADCADFIVIPACTANALFLCDRKTVRLGIRRHQSVDFSLNLNEVIFDGVEIAPAMVIDQAGDALQHLRNLNALVAAAEMNGAADRILALTADFARQREQFGRPIGSFQAIKHKLSDMYVALETSRTATYFAAWCLAESLGAETSTSTAKALAGDASRRVCNDALQIHGGMGYTWDVDVHLFMRRCKYLESAYGDGYWHRERFLAGVLGGSPARTVLHG